MAKTDWAELQGSASSAVVRRGPDRPGLPGPNGNTGDVYFFNSIDSTLSASVGMVVDLNGFNPTGTGPENPDGGGYISMAMKKLPSPSNKGFSVFGFFCAQGSPTVNDKAYMLGLSDQDPYEIVLVKGIIAAGVSTLARTDLQILRRSAAQYATSDNLWHHLKLECIVQPNGSVSLVCKKSNLSVNTVIAPVWEDIEGMSIIVDDSNYINTGTPPLLGGYCGFGYSTSFTQSGRAAIAVVEPKAQQPAYI